MVIRQYDILINPDKQSEKFIPYFIALQSDVLMPLATIVVAPLRQWPSPKALTKLNPTLKIGKQDYYIEMQSLAAVPSKRFRDVKSNATEMHAACVAAVDLIFTGI
jgi:toxin CcdB